MTDSAPNCFRNGHWKAAPGVQKRAPAVGARHSPSNAFSGLDVTRCIVAIGIFATVALRNWELVVYAAQYFMVLSIVFHLSTKRLGFSGSSELSVG